MLRRFGCATRDRISACDGRVVRVIIWLAVVGFLLGFGDWAAHSGLHIRREAWIYSRSIRYHGDVRNALNWGSEVLQAARSEMTPAPVPTPQRPEPDFWEIVRAEGKIYDDLVNGGNEDYRLDYPPVRLLVMSLWTRHVESQFPFFMGWPGPWRQGARVSEEIVAPMLDINSLFTGLGAIFAFFLVWLWVARGGRRNSAEANSLLGQRRPPMRPSTPLIRSAGLLLFPPLFCFFYYALLIAVAPAPVAPPMVNFSGPTVLARDGGNITATIHATINPQGESTRWSADWGTEPGDYSHVVAGDPLVADGTPTDVSVTLQNLPDHAVVHYRITARNDGPNRGLGRGMTRTDDGILQTDLGDAPQPMPPAEIYNSMWLSLWQWIGIGALFALVCGSIRWLPAEHRGWALGLLAAVLIWLNPALIIDSHVWPQWEVWVLPPFLLAALLSSLDWWFCAGLVFGIGAMFKGQFLIGAPVLILWPLLAGRWGALARMLVGIVLSTGLLLSPFITLRNLPFSWSMPAVQWIVRVGLAVVIASILPLLRRPMVREICSLWGPKEDISLKRIGIVAGVTAALVIATIALILAGWPQDSDLPRSAGLFLFLGVLIAPWVIRRRWLGVVLAGSIGVAIWMTAWIYHGDWAWETVGFEYGTKKFDTIAMGKGSNGNLGSILGERFGWELHDPAMTLHLPNLTGWLPMRWLGPLGLDGNPVPLELRQVLIGAFALCITACAAGAAMNDRRNHPRFLAAMVAPWMLMPNTLGQMMCRYQIWGAALSALLVGISPGFTLLNVLASILATGMVANQLLGDDPGRSPQLRQLMSTLSPDDGWIMLCMTALVLYVAATPGSAAEPAPELMQLGTLKKTKRGPESPVVSSNGNGAPVEAQPVDSSPNEVRPPQPLAVSQISV